MRITKARTTSSFLFMMFMACGTVAGQNPNFTASADTKTTGANRAFSVPVAEVPIQGREIPANADLAALKLKMVNTDHKAKVVLGPEQKISFGGMTMLAAPDLVQVLIDGHDLAQ
jgi:hypothetical protein